ARLAKQPAEHADEARPDLRGLDLLHIKAMPVEPIRPRRPHLAPDSLLAEIGQDLPQRHWLAALGGDNAYLAGGNDGVVFQLRGVSDGHDEVPALGLHLRLDALLPGPGQDLAGIERA